jgi:hypothetical protein
MAFLLCAVPAVVGQERLPLSNTGSVQCERAAKSGGVREWVESKAGFAAALELGAVVTGNGDGRKCVTSWKLHVKGKEGKEQVFTVAQREDFADEGDWAQENSFEIEGWSRDGSLLLAAQIEAQEDWDETTPIVFDFSTNTFRRVELYPLFKRVIPDSCNVVYRPLGFAEDGRVLIKAMSTDNDREPGTKACFPESRWNLDFRRRTIVPVAPVNR